MNYGEYYSMLFGRLLRAAQHLNQGRAVRLGAAWARWEHNQYRIFNQDRRYRPLIEKAVA